MVLFGAAEPFPNQAMIVRYKASLPQEENQVFVA